MTYREQLAEMETLLSERDSRLSPRRKHHHLPPDTYVHAGVPYCVTLCARQHGAPFLTAHLAATVIDALLHYRGRGLCLVYAYCLMPDHLHVVLQLQAAEGGGPVKGLGSLISDFKRFTTTQVAWKHGLTGALWQRDFYDHIPRSAVDLESQCRYVLNNPVRKGLVTDWREYRWSGIPDPWDDP